MTAPRPPRQGVPRSTPRGAAHTADGLATALLAGPWQRPDMLRRLAGTLDRPRPPRWLGPLVTEVLAAYRDPPADRPRELAAFLRTTSAWARGQDTVPRPRPVRLTPVPTAVVRHVRAVPELADLSALARLLDLDQGELAWFADNRGLERHAGERLRHYHWRIVERPGGVRLLAAPRPRLKEIQRRLLRHVLAPLPPHPAAHGCVPGRSVRTAAAPHAGAQVVLRMDLATFFPAIPAPRVWGLLRSVAGLPEPVAHAVTGLVTTVLPAAVWARVPRPAEAGELDRYRQLGQRLRAPHLSQGAPTSPAVANLVCFRLDRRLAALAERYGAVYTRYVDDLTFSGNRQLHAGRLARAVADVVADEGFAVNPAKTQARTAAARQLVLGVVVNAHPALPRPQRDALRALLHNCAVRGPASQARGKEPEAFRAHVLGRVAWAASVDPAFGARLRALADRIDWAR